MKKQALLFTNLGIALGMASSALALPPRPTGDPILPPKITGSVVLSNCQAQKTDVRVRVMPGNRSVTMATAVGTGDGRIRMTYSIPMLGESEGTLTVTPSIRQGVCSGGSFTPSSRTVSAVPATNVNFAYGVQGSNEYRIAARDFASTIDLLLNTLKMKLDNERQQNSFIEVAGRRVGFQIPRVTVDIDCGTLCPDLGDGHFYLRDINLSNAAFEFDGTAFDLGLRFEDQGREIKGFHSKLGDNGMPDFELSNIRLGLKGRLRVTTNGELAMGFYAPKLEARIDATGGCRIAGIDVCNKVFGTDRKIQRGAEQAALQSLNSGTVQALLSQALRQYLQYRGINGRILSVRLDRGDILLTIQ